MTTPPKTNLPLQGIRLLEFSQLIMGPAVGMIFADLGADVIKVEPIGAGDPTRHLTGFPAGFFPYFNRNKRSLAVDLKSTEGLALVRRLVGTADIAVENFAPGTIERLGCDGPSLCALNERLIFCSLKGFLDGPYAHRQALDEVVQFMGGLAYMTGPAGRPLRAGTSVVDLMGATMAVIAILTALRERDHTGRGQIVKAGLFESTVFMVGQHMAGAVASQELVQPMPEKRGGWSVYETFETADGKPVFIAITSDNHWRRFCDAFGFDDLRNDERLTTNDMRVAARPWLIPKLTKLIGGMTSAQVMTLCDKANVPFAPVSRIEDLFDDPHLNESGALVDVEIAGRQGKLPRLPIRLGAHRLDVTRQPPAIGQHTREILSEIGMPPQEIESLEKRSIVSG